jgi:D-lactate dehydrogenase (cytochrome)
MKAHTRMEGIMNRLVSIQNLLEDLKGKLREDQISENLTVRTNHSKDESYLSPKLPEAVIFPESTEEVCEIVTLADYHDVPIIPFGLGSSTEGHIIPIEPSITIDFSQMNKILEIREKDFLVKVQPGVTRLQLNKELKKHGLFFPVDPGADATLGGMAATNASGTLSVRYGVMRDQVRDMEVVLPNATVIHTGNLAVKSSSGYHLNGLFVGSEGTLGCITEITLKVSGIPEKIMAARASFNSLDDAVDSVTAIIQAGIPIARVELVDEHSIRQVNKFNEMSYEENPTLFMEFHGNEAALEQDVAFAKEIVKDYHCLDFQFEKDTANRNKLWEIRHNIVPAYYSGYPGLRLMTTDVCVPISELAGAIKHARKTVDGIGFPAGIVGHVGDGNFHVLIMLDTDNADEVQKAEKLNEQIVEYALERGGTCTGEHGVGFGKQKYQEKEHGNALQVMQQVKSVLDPKGLFNPYKVLNLKGKAGV